MIFQNLSDSRGFRLKRGSFSPAEASIILVGTPMLYIGGCSGALSEEIKPSDSFVLSIRLFEKRQPSEALLNGHRNTSPASGR